MEKRMILAFALSFVVLIAWAFLFAPAQRKAHRQEAESQKNVERPPVERAGTEIPRSVILPEKGQESIQSSPSPTGEKEIVIDTPLYRAVFSNAGPTIKNFALRKYRQTADPHSPPIELVNIGKSGENFFEMLFNRQSASENKNILYHVDKTSLHLERGSPPGDLTFTSVGADGVSINQTYRFYADRYNIDLDVGLENRSGQQVDGDIEARLNSLPPEEKNGYYTFMGVALLLNNKLEEIAPKKMKDEDRKLSGAIGWMAYEDKYFISAVIPDNQGDGRFTGRLLPSGVIKASYAAPPISLRPSERTSSRFTLYLGPRDLDILKSSGKKLEKAIDYGFWDIIAKPLLVILRFFNRYLSNYGVSILALTLLIKILFWPLAHKSYKSMKEMQKIQPLMAKIREKYKGDKQQMNKEMMSLYKTYKVNPMGGCLPMIVQIPVFFALYRVLGNSIELRHAPFVLWINDLSAPDRLLHFSFHIPFMSPPYGIPVLTLFMGVSMFIQQKMTPTAGDPSQAKIMMFLPIVFTVMFINFPSGLVLYWLTQNILSIGQQYFILKKSA